ncbi:MAG: two-component system cell cycle sensor histidine kinase/response regulator CckA [Planctomycetota bacterium]|jgi:two-component system cell cycle sensor histidine kinase/response regulator CckA
MTQETQRRISDPFFTTKSVGRGLGLVAVQGIVWGQDGAIALESELGQGTAFTLYLPWVTIDDSDSNSCEDESPDVVNAHILVVDDEIAVLDILASTLERGGYRVSRASDGQETIDLYRSMASEIDCVLLDLSMRRLDGVETFQAMRQIRPDARVVLSSGFSERDIKALFQGAPLAGAIRKPATMPDFLATIASALSQNSA